VLTLILICMYLGVAIYFDLHLIWVFVKRDISFLSQDPGSNFKPQTLKSCRYSRIITFSSYISSSCKSCKWFLLLTFSKKNSVCSLRFPCRSTSSFHYAWADQPKHFWWKVSHKAVLYVNFSINFLFLPAPKTILKALFSDTLVYILSLRREDYIKIWTYLYSEKLHIHTKNRHIYSFTHVDLKGLGYNMGWETILSGTVERVSSGIRHIVADNSPFLTCCATSVI
jgi:hypothetical protein